MVNIFNTLLANSLNISFFIIILFCLEPFLKKYFSAVCLYRLWVVLLIGLLIPIHIGSTKALFYISSPRIAVDDKALYRFDMEENDMRNNTTSHTDSFQKSRTQDTENGYHHVLGNEAYFLIQLIMMLHYIKQNWYAFICLIWMLGALLLLFFKGVQCYQYLKALKRFMVPVSNETFQHYCSILKLELNDRKGLLQGNKIMIYQCSVITSPLTLGILRPIILLPNESYSDKDYLFILKHELIHIQRKDSLIKLIRLFVLAFNWYNPFCYVLSRHLDHWCETSCDELVIHNATRDDRMNYSKLLLQYTKTEKAISIINQIGGKDNMRKRLYSIIHHKKRFSSKMLILLSLCIMFTTSFVSVGNRKEVAASSVKTEIEEALVSLDKSDNDTAENTISNPNKDNLADKAITKESTEASDTNPKETLTADELRERVVEYAKQAEGAPYLWGGDDLSRGVDTSGFVKVIYKKFNFDLPRKSWEQAGSCERVSMDKLKLGDLIFYGNPDDNKVNHVGIYIGKNKIIHAKNLKDGVTIQKMNYRTPICAGRVIKD